jgi:excisionase family DNA binding protein
LPGRQCPPSPKKTAGNNRFSPNPGKSIRAKSGQTKKRNTMTDTAQTADLLYGARAIADYLGIKQRAAEHLIETKRIPFFKIGRTVAARRSKVMAALEELEGTAA